MAIKSTNEILSEILSIITSGLPLPDIKVQLEYIMHNQNLSNNLQEQILQYINIISDNSDTDVDLLRTFIQIFSSYSLDMHSFYQDWLANQVYVKETLGDIKLCISNDYDDKQYQLVSAIKDNTDSIRSEIIYQKQPLEVMQVLLEQLVMNFNNLVLLANLNYATINSIDKLIEDLNNNVLNLNNNVDKTNKTVDKINDKIPSYKPELKPKPKSKPIPPLLPKPSPKPKPKPIIDGSVKWFWCKCYSQYVRFCPKYDCYHCPENPNANVIWKKVDFEIDSDS